MSTRKIEEFGISNRSVKVASDKKGNVMNVNEFTYISPKHKHLLTNISIEICVMIEVQYGGYFG